MIGYIGHILDPVTILVGAVALIAVAMRRDFQEMAQ